MAAIPEPEASPSILAYDRNAILRIHRFTQELRATPEGFRAEAHEERAIAAAEQNLDSFRKAMGALLGTPAAVRPAAGRRRATEAKELLRNLLSAHALTLATGAEFDAMTSAGAAPAAASQVPGWLNTLMQLLGKLANWIWSVIQTLLTPKGWSIEGGVTVPGLAQAKLTITFGR